ncbi:MAG: branched-chain amino acid ABC transporter permease [Castellaniella sp.]|uniref:branched-chain amino acid ABC transporter permease n=1 Tax=Castellaniella sp. TaxID=1955812 RepID=UPI002A365789|nr:branched-chain amino acid ABC transporter permease [Castellaniella sp.]MDY0309297.1 branched-chain amino acid ABC transporter permease [Castellaniella sp.]
MDKHINPSTRAPSGTARVLRLAGPALWALGLLIPQLLSPAWITIGGIFAIYSIVALSQDIVLGRAGMYDMGHAVFFGIGAYTCAILSLFYNWPVLWTIPVAILLAAALGAILSAPIVKLRGDYLLVVTIGFNAIFVLAMQNNLFGLTGGADGLFGVSGPTLFGHMFGTQSDLFYLDWIVLAIVLWLMRNLDRSSLGRTFRYLKHDELAATTLGVNARNYKVAAFALSAGLAGLAGTLFAMQLSAVSPGSFRFTDSVVLFAIVLVGGQASVPGVLLGTAMMFVVPQIFTEFAQYRYLAFGVAMILVMILRPQGIWPARKGVI